MQPLKISFIVPVYNAQPTAEWFDACMESLFAQTYDNFEIILVDDASTDDTAERLLALQARDSRVRIITHTENKKPYGARNTGLEACSGDYVFSVDHDDYVYCRAAEIIAAAAESHGKPDLIRYKYITDGKGTAAADIKQQLSAANSGTLTTKVVKNRKWMTDYFLRRKTHSVWAYAVKSEVATSARFPLYYPEDLPYSLEIHALSQSALKLNATLYYYRIYGDSVSHSMKWKKVSDGHWLAVKDMDAIIATHKLAKEFPLSCRYFQLLWRCVTLVYFLRYVFSRLSLREAKAKKTPQK